LPVDAAALRSTIEARDYVVDIGGWVRRGWELVKANAGLLIGGTLLSLVIQGAVGAIPFLGGIASLILQGALIGGMYWLFLRCLRGEAAGIGDIFAGFQRGFVNLMLTNIVTGLLVGVCLLPGAVVLGIGLMLHLAAKSPAGIPVAIGGGVLLLCLLPVAIYLALCFAFALPLVIDRQLGFWDAMQLSRHMVRKHWWGIFGAGIVFGLVGAAGLLACLVGVVVTMPIVIAAWMCAYEDIFGERPAQVG
jgi:uncharacterized membrane protein